MIAHLRPRPGSVPVFTLRSLLPASYPTAFRTHRPKLLLASTDRNACIRMMALTRRTDLRCALGLIPACSARSSTAATRCTAHSRIAGMGSRTRIAGRRLHRRRICPGGPPGGTGQSQLAAPAVEIAGRLRAGVPSSSSPRADPAARSTAAPLPVPAIMVRTGHSHTTNAPIPTTCHRRRPTPVPPKRPLRAPAACATLAAATSAASARSPSSHLPPSPTARQQHPFIVRAIIPQSAPSSTHSPLTSARAAAAAATCSSLGAALSDAAAGLARRLLPARWRVHTSHLGT
jgi:hypothetical protein